MDPTTLEVEVRADRRVSELFQRLDALGIDVTSLKNKSNRLEELFLRILHGKDNGRTPAASRWPREGEAPAERLVPTTRQEPRPPGRRLGGSLALPPRGTARNLRARTFMYSRTDLIALQTILVKETVRILRIWVQTLLPPVITMSLYFVIFGRLIGARIGEISVGGAGGTTRTFPYIQFVVPGLVMMSIITNSFSNVVSSFFGAKFQKHVEELLVSPMPNSILLLGYVGGGVARGLMVGVLVTLVALFFTRLPIANVPVTISVVVLTAVLFSLGGFINAVLARNFDDISIFPTFVLTPLTYLGGVFYSIDMLPEFWRRVSMANPVLYMVSAFRYGILGVSDIPLGVAYTVIIGFTAGFWVLALWLLKHGKGLRS